MITDLPTKRIKSAITVTNISQVFTYAIRWRQKSKGIDIEQNYVTVTLPICKAAVATTRYDMRCYFNVRSEADTSQLNLSHGTNN